MRLGLFNEMVDLVSMSQYVSQKTKQCSSEEWKEYVKKKRGVPREDVVPSSLAGEIYDRYCHGGLVWELELWQMVHTFTLSTVCLHKTHKNPL